MVLKYECSDGCYTGPVDILPDVVVDYEDYKKLEDEHKQILENIIKEIILVFLKKDESTETLKGYILNIEQYTELQEIFKKYGVD